MGDIIVFIFQAVIAIFGFVLGLLFGWVFIIGCTSSIFNGAPNASTCTNAGVSIMMYAGIGIILYGVHAWNRHLKGHELSPFWRFIALFVLRRELSKVSENTFDARQFRDEPEVPATTGGKHMMTTVYAKTATAMENRRVAMDEKTSTYLEASRKRAEEAEKLHRAQARLSEIEKWERERKRGKR